MAAIAMLMGAAKAHAQTIDGTNYPFSNTTGVTLEDMSSGTTQLVAANLDDTASAVTAIGFDFWFLAQRFTQFSVNANGLARLGPVAVSTSFDNGSAATGFASVTNNPKVAPYYDDLWVGTNGRVHYKVVGVAPNRKLVVEWLNMQIPRVGAGVAGAGTFQMWLFETTGVIEFVYGSGVALNAANAGYSVGLANGAVNFASVTTSVPSVSYAAANNTQTNAVASGTAYLFTPPTPTPPGGPLTFTGVTALGMTLNWTDSPDELAYGIDVSTDGTNFAPFATAAAGTTAFPATGLVPSTTYFWNVYAVSSGALSSALSGSQATPPPGNVVSTGAGGLWSNAATWAGGVVPAPTDAVTIADGSTVSIDTAATAWSVTVGQGGSGVLEYESATARTLTVGSDVTVAPGGTLQSNAAGTVTTHNLSVGGNLTNDGVLDFATNANTAGATITFTGAANTSFSGTGATTNIRLITVSKGTSATSVVQLMPANFTVQGVTTNVAGWLTQTAGTLRLSGSFSGTNRVFPSATYVIPVNCGFWLDNPNYTVVGQAGLTTTSNNGLLRVSQGVFNIGVGAADGMRGGTGAVFVIEGGTVNSAGRIDPQLAVSYTQTGGTVNVATVGNTLSAFGSFEIFSTASTFFMSGGTINLVNPATGATKDDYTMRAVAQNISGGLVVFGTGGAPASYAIPFGTSFLPNFVVNPTMTLNINNVAVFFRGTAAINNGTITSTGTGARFDFAGAAPMAYSGTGTFGTAAVPFGGVGVSSNSTSLVTLSSPLFVNRINLFSGGFVNSNLITLGNAGASTTVVQIGSTGLTTSGGSFDVSPVHNQGTGGQILLYQFETTPRTTGVEINPTRSLARMVLDNPNHLTVSGGDLTLTSALIAPNHALTLTNGRVITGPSILYISSGAGVVTRTNGFVHGNYRKAYAAVASKTFEIGTVNGFSPVVFNATAGTFPADTTVSAVQGTFPGLFPPTQAISRYWQVLSSTGLTGDLTFTYLDPADIPGTVTEANLHVYRHDGSTLTDLVGVINTGANTGAVTGVATTPSSWTLAEAGAVLATDLAITKTDGQGSAIPGQNVVYTITASNSGPTNAVGATVTDNFPPACATVSWTCVGAGGGTCAPGPVSGDINDLVDLPAGASVTYTATCAVSSSATGTLANTATIAPPGGIVDLNAANDAASDTDTLVPTADLSATKTDGVGVVLPGGNTTYTIVASNPGPSDAPGTLVADAFPADLTCTWTCVGSGGGTCTPGPVAGNINDTANLPGGASATYTAACAISGAASGTISNTATATPAGGVSDPNATNNAATDIDVVGASADVSITKTDGVTTAVPGASVTYTIVASNAGPSTAAGTTVADSFPAELTCTWTCVGAGGGTCTPGPVAGNINDTADLPVGGSATYTANCAIASSATGTLVNTATATVAGGIVDPNLGNNAATDTDVLAPTADLTITKDDGVTTAIPGQQVTYTITATNPGPSDSPQSAVADAFPALLSCTSTCVGNGGAACLPGPVAGDINAVIDFPAGSSVTYTSTCSIPPSATGTLANTATIAEGVGVTDPTPGNNSATDTDTLAPTADLGITKDDGGTTATPGTIVTYTIVATNPGPSDDPGAGVTDTFPPEVVFCTWTCAGSGGATCTPSGIGNISEPTPLPSGGAVTFTASCGINPFATGSLSNDAVVAPSVNDTDPANNQANDTDTLVPTGDLAVTKDDGVVTVPPGGSLSYTIVASDLGPSGSQGNPISDPFPTDLTCTWTCIPDGSFGTTCNPGPVSGDINDTPSIAPSGSVTYTANCTVSPTATGAISNTVTLAVLPGFTDPDPSNNSATDVDAVAQGLSVADVIVVEGNSGATPADFLVTLDAPSAVTVTVDFTTVDGTATAANNDYTPLSGTLIFAPGELSKIVSSSVNGDTNFEADENFFVSLSNATGAVILDGIGLGTILNDDKPLAVDTRDELIHDSRETRDLDSISKFWRISQKARSSYEVIVDGVTGDIVGAGGPDLLRLDSDGATVLQTAGPATTGSSKSLRFENTGASNDDGQFIRVRSAGCVADCDSGDTVRIRAYDTTYRMARFNNSASQITLVVIANPTDQIVTGNLWFYTASTGTLAATQPVTIPAKGTFVLNTSGIVTGAGSATFSNDAAFGALTGKAVAVEPATGFTFDTAMVPRTATTKMVPRDN